MSSLQHAMTRPVVPSALSALAPERLPLLQQPLPRSCDEGRLAVVPEVRLPRRLVQVQALQPGLAQAWVWPRAVAEVAARRLLPEARTELARKLRQVRHHRSATPSW